MEQTTRKTYLDAARILACIGVIYNHVMGYALVERAGAGFLPMFAYFLSKQAVPLFLMITGALLLPRVDSYKRTLLRFLRIAAALTLAMALNYALYCLREGEAFDVGRLILSVYRDRIGITYSYWYLYRYLSLIVMLPILQRLTARMRLCDIRYFLFFSIFVCGTLFSVRFFCPDIHPSEPLSIPLFSVYIGMLLMGFYIDRYVDIRRGYILPACAGLIACTAIAAWLMLRAQAIDLETAWHIDRSERTSVMLAAGCLLYLVKCADGRLALPTRVRSGISRVGRLTFAVYLVSEPLIDNLDFVRAWLWRMTPGYGADLLYVLVVFAAGMAIAAVLTRIPLLKKLL